MVPATVALINKYWPGQDITVLAYDTKWIVGKLPQNAELVPLGVPDDSPIWTDALIPYFSSCDFDYFALILDEVPPVAPVNLEAVAEMEKHIASGFASKAMLHAHLNEAFGEPVPGLETKAIQLAAHATYRTSLHPAIWRTDYFLRYLRPGLTPQAFEVANEKAAQLDGCTILSWPAQDHRHDHVFPCLDVYRRGSLNHSDYWGLRHRKAPPEDLALIKSYLGIE